MAQLACSRQARFQLKLKLQVGPECGTNKSNIASITVPILTKVLMEGFLDKTTTKIKTGTAKTTTTTIYQLLLTRF